MTGSSSPSTDDTPAASLVEHTKRPEWGVGLLTWEDTNRRRYHFRDGKTRTFKRGWYDFLKRAEPPMAERALIVAELEQGAGLAEARRDRLDEARDRGVKLMTFDEQIQVFFLLFPGGLEDEAWVNDVRGEGRARSRKQDRQGSIDLARDLLAQDKMEAGIAAGDFEGLFAGFVEVLTRTSLVSPSKDVTPLAAWDEATKEGAVRALYSLLWNEEASLGERFNAWRAALLKGGNPVTWQLFTTPAALVHPEQHVCVHPTAFRTQAKWIAPSYKWPTGPTGDGYLRLLEIAHRVHSEMVQGGLAPRDLMDVREFIARTLRPSAKAALESRNAEVLTPVVKSLKTDDDE